MSICSVFSPVVGREVCKILLSFALFHFVLQGQICLLFQVSLEFLLLHSSPLAAHAHGGDLLATCVQSQAWIAGPRRHPDCLLRTLRFQKHELEGTMERASFYISSHLTDGAQRPKKGINLFKKAFHAVCGILVPGPRIEPVSPAVEGWSLNHWATWKSQSPTCRIQFPNQRLDPIQGSKSPNHWTAREFPTNELFNNNYTLRMSLPSGSFLKPLILIHPRVDRLKTIIIES